MNRRGFFTSVGKLLAVGSIAPSIFIPKIEPVIWKVPKFRTLTCAWSMELAEDLEAYHGISAVDELTRLFESLHGLKPCSITASDLNNYTTVYDPVTFEARRIVHIKVI